VTVKFPRVNGRSLAGDDVRLPDDLPAERTLALLAFQQRHQACVDRWIARAEAAGIPGSPLDMDAEDRACVVEIPVLSSGWKLGRGFIDGGMAANIRIPRVLARTITVYVLARVPGEPTDSAWQVIAEALAQP